MLFLFVSFLDGEKLSIRWFYIFYYFEGRKHRSPQFTYEGQNYESAQGGRGAGGGGGIGCLKDTPYH